MSDRPQTIATLSLQLEHMQEIHEIEIKELRGKHQENKEEILHLKKENQSIKKKLQEYDKFALKYGSFAMGIFCLGAALLMGADRLKSSLSSILLSWGKQ